MIIEDIENIIQKLQEDHYHSNHVAMCHTCNYLYQSLPYLIDMAKQCRALAHNFQEFPGHESPILIHKILDSVDKLEYFELVEP